MSRWALVKDGAVVNVVESDQPPSVILGGQWVLDADGQAEPGGGRGNGQFTRARDRVPAAVTARQAFLALRRAGLLSQVDAALAAIPDADARAEAQITWNKSLEVQRDHPLVAQLAGALGLNQRQLDQLFIQAARL